MSIVKGWQKYDPDTLKLQRPTLRYTYDPSLSIHEAVRIKRTGDHHIRSMEEIADSNQAFENDVFTSLALLNWVEDYNNGLSPEEREKLERTQKAPEE